MGGSSREGGREPERQGGREGGRRRLPLPDGRPRPRQPPPRRLLCFASRLCMHAQGGPTQLNTEMQPRFPGPSQCMKRKFPVRINALAPPPCSDDVALNGKGKRGRAAWRSGCGPDRGQLPWRIIKSILSPRKWRGGEMQRGGMIDLAASRPLYFVPGPWCHVTRNFQNGCAGCSKKF